MIALALHGGAGTLPRSEMSQAQEALYRAGLAQALTPATPCSSPAARAWMP